MDGYRESKVFTFPNMIVRVHFPDISTEERERRMKMIEQAAAELLKETRKKK